MYGRRWRGTGELLAGVLPAGALAAGRARLKPGVTPEAANAELQTVVRQLQVEYPVTNKVMGADLDPLHEFLIGDVSGPPDAQAAVAVLLLIACANVANLLLVQAVVASARPRCD
jgi:hypothetical protein